MIFKTKNNELAIFGQTLNNVKKTLTDTKNVWMQDNKFSFNKTQIIPDENLIKELSFDEAKKILDSFNKSVVNGSLSLEQYFKECQDGNDILRTYITTTDQQNLSAQGLVNASKEARAAQIAQNEAIKNTTVSAQAGK